MLNKIIEGIAIKLNKIFGDVYPIYNENIEQDLNEPCFLITCISAQASEMLLERYHRDNAFDIQYFPQLPDDKTEMLTIAERMYAGLNHITLTDGSVRNGTAMYGAAQPLLPLLIVRVLYVGCSAIPAFTH